MNAITTVEQYLAASRNDPRLRRTTLHYIADMIDYFGKERVFEGIYGMDRQISDIIAFFKGYAMSMERRLLLLVGPQGSGKSMTVDKLKRWLEEYSHKPDGALYAVDGCPFHQHPFDVIPPADREAEGVWWHEEAVPCPVCERIIARSGGWRQVPVRQIFISARDKIGVAKHTPTDLRREDITNFVGNINFAMLKERGSTYDPEAYDFEGEMQIYRTLVERANRVRGEYKHVPEDVYELAATYAVRTRQDSQGLRGLSPRFFEDAFSLAYTRAARCIDLEVITEAIEDTFAHQSIKDLNQKDLLKMFEETKVEFVNKKVDQIIEEIVPTHFYDYGQNLYLNYLDASARNVLGEALAETEKELIDEVEGILVQKRLISRQGRVAFENVLVERRDELRRMSYRDNEQLRGAINEIVFNKIKNCLRLYEKTEEMDAKSRELLEVLERSAIEEHGYCSACARSLFKIIGRSF